MLQYRLQLLKLQINTARNKQGRKQLLLIQTAEMENKTVEFSLITNSALLDTFLEFGPINLAIVVDIEHIKQSLLELAQFHRSYRQ